MPHYVAQVKIEKVIPANEPARSGASTSRRQKGELAHLTLRADTVEDLIAKVTKHLDLVEESSIEMGD